MKILVTGGAGFIGSYVVRHFVEQGHDVCVATRNTYAGKMRNIQEVLSQITLLIGDLAEPWFAQECVAWDPEWVVHMAAETHVDRAIDDPLCFMRANVLGTTNLLQAVWKAQHLGPAKILVYSTDEVYGPTPPGMAFDEHAPWKPSNAYSASKVGIEGIAQSFWVTHGLPIVVVRPCNTYGPRQHPEKVIPKFVRQMLQGTPVTLYNDGMGSRDWLFGTDHASAVEVLLEQGRCGEAYNLGAGEEHTDTEIYQEIMRYFAGRWMPPYDYVPGRPGHDRRYYMDWTKLRRLGWEPTVSFAEGFRQTVAWNLAHQDWWSSDTVEGQYGVTTRTGA